MLSLLPKVAAGNKVQMIFDKSLPTWRIMEFNAYVENKASYLLSEKGAAFSSDAISSKPSSSLLLHSNPERSVCASSFFTEKSLKLNLLDYI